MKPGDTPLSEEPKVEVLPVNAVIHDDPNRDNPCYCGSNGCPDSGPEPEVMITVTMTILAPQSEAQPVLHELLTSTQHLPYVIRVDHTEPV